MKVDSSCKPETFGSGRSVFGACYPESMKLLLVVEAESVEEARTSVNALASLLGVSGDSELAVVPLKEMPAGVPTFMKAFFEAKAMAISKGHAAAGTSTVQ